MERLNSRIVYWQAEALTLTNRRSRLHERWEAVKEVKSLIEGPHEQIPEAFLRSMIAEQYGVTPAEVTWDQIWLEVSRLCVSGGYRAVEVVPSAEAPDEDQKRFEYLLAPDRLEALHEYLGAFLSANPFTDDESSPPEESNAHTRTSGTAGESAQMRTQDAPPTAEGTTDKGNLAILRSAGKFRRAVTLDVARRFGGVSRRAIQEAVRKNTLKTEGNRQQRRVLVDSLLKYFPPEK